MRCTRGNFSQQWYCLLQLASKAVSVLLWLQCVYVPSGNGITERSHRSKRIPARKQCAIAEATHCYSVTPKDCMSLVTAPANTIYTYPHRSKGIDTVQSPDDEVCWLYAGGGDPVLMKPPGSWCTTRFKCGRVTGMVSQQSVLVDGIPHHIHDLHPALEIGHSVTDESDESSGDELLMDATSGPPKNVTASLSDDSEVETGTRPTLKACRPKGYPLSALCVIKRSGGSVTAIMLTRNEKG